MQDNTNITPPPPALLEVKRSLSFYFTPEQMEQIKSIVQENSIVDAKSLFAFLLTKINRTTPDHTAEIERLNTSIKNYLIEKNNIIAEREKIESEIEDHKHTIYNLNELLKTSDSILERLDKANSWLSENYSRIKSFCSVIPKQF